jgi:NADH-quinone oxidoreductase subunit H
VAVFVGVPIALLVLAGLLIASRTANRDTRLMAEEATAGGVHATDPDPDSDAEVLPPAGPRHRSAQRGGPARAEGGFPVPPMDLTVPPSPRLRRAEPVGATAGRPDGAAAGVVSSGRRGSTATRAQEDPDG